MSHVTIHIFLWLDSHLVFCMAHIPCKISQDSFASRMFNRHILICLISHVKFTIVTSVLPYYIIFRYKVINVILTSIFYFISSKPHLTSHIYDVTCPMSQVSPFTDDPPFTNFSKYACLQWIVNKLWMVKVSKRSFASLIEHIANTLLYYTWGSHYIRSLI